jgi:hypothetical protein
MVCVTRVRWNSRYRILFRSTKQNKPTFVYIEKNFCQKEEAKIPGIAIEQHLIWER